MSDVSRDDFIVLSSILHAKVTGLKLNSIVCACCRHISRSEYLVVVAIVVVGIISSAIGTTNAVMSMLHDLKK